jgi:thioredoxin reductase (NADPH)
MEKRKVIIIGGGCSGLTAAIYSARAQLSPLVIAGIKGGGQLTLTTEVENFPGFPEGIQGPELVGNMRAQATRFGAEFMDVNVTSVDFSKRPFTVTTSEKSFQADSVIVATGADARMTGITGEDKLMGHGVSTCATCDGFFYRGKEIAVVGGGDSAMEEATFLTKFASKVTVIHRRDELRASKAMQQKAFDNPKIEFIWDTVPIEALDGGTGGLTGLKLQNLKDNTISEIAVDGLFVAIGHIPNTDIFKGHLTLDDQGYILPLGDGSTATNVKGVFTSGDVHDKRYRQAITASAMGCMAAIDTEKFLEGHND